jgi:uncharacterized membrane protein YcaP (DUF421 family)
MRRLREEGIDDVKEVRAAYVESDGAISIIGGKPPGSGKESRDKRAL